MRFRVGWQAIPVPRGAFAGPEQPNRRYPRQTVSGSPEKPELVRSYLGRRPPQRLQTSRGANERPAAGWAGAGQQTLAPERDRPASPPPPSRTAPVAGGRPVANPAPPCPAKRWAVVAGLRRPRHQVQALVSRFVVIEARRWSATACARRISTAVGWPLWWSRRSPTVGRRQALSPWNPIREQPTYRITGCRGVRNHPPDRPRSSPVEQVGRR